MALGLCPTLETKFVAANTLISLPQMDQMALIDPSAHQIEAEIEALHHRYFSIQRRDQKLSTQRKLKDLLRSARKGFIRKSGFFC